MGRKRSRKWRRRKTKEEEEEEEGKEEKQGALLYVRDYLPPRYSTY